MSTQSEAKKAKLEKPANYYKSPDDITKDADLSPDEKRQALNTWEQDARQMLTASNEEEGLDQRNSSISRAACGLATSARMARRNSS